MELTHQDKARVFAMYMQSAEVIFPMLKNGKFVYEIGFSPIVKLGAASYYDVINSPSFDKIKLHLKDLSDISDEDAIELGNLGKFKSDKWRYTGVRNGFICYMQIGVGNTEWICSPYLDINVQQADFLRSKSYMIPYKGINLFEAGIAIRKTKKA